MIATITRRKPKTPALQRQNRSRITDQGHRSAAAMSTDTIDKDLNEYDRRIVDAADQMWQRMTKGDSHYEDWSIVRDALMVGRQYAMRVLHIQEPKGKATTNSLDAGATDTSPP